MRGCRGHDLPPTLRLIPLGGLGEVGMNCMVAEHGGSRVLIDCGVTFPGRTYGVDLDHPSFAYLSAERPVDALLITHGHEDHIGAIPFLLAHLHLHGRVERLPVYGPAYALALIERRLNEHDGVPRPELIKTHPGQRFRVGAFDVEPYRVNHSIPDATGLILKWSGGTAVHSGDFKIEQAPMDGQSFDHERLQQLGDDGVDVLMSDSTNIDVEGASGEETEVADAIAELMRAAPQRIVIAQFASNVYRMQAVFAAARACGRKVCLLGRSVESHATVARQLGLLQRIDPLLVAQPEARKVARSRFCAIATGTQAEWPAALTRLSRGDHAFLELEPGDTVVLSSRIIPGQEKLVYQMIDGLERQGVRVLHRHSHPEVHVSGHACRDEQRQLIELLRPRTFMPVHGSFHHLQAHAALAESLGVDRICVVENGAVVEVTDREISVVDEAPAGRVHIGRRHIVDDVQLRDRRLLGELGVVFVSFASNGAFGRRSGDPRTWLLGERNQRRPARRAGGFCHGRAQTPRRGRDRRTGRSSPSGYQALLQPDPRTQTSRRRAWR